MVAKGLGSVTGIEGCWRGLGDTHIGTTQHLGHDNDLNTICISYDSHINTKHLNFALD